MATSSDYLIKYFNGFSAIILGINGQFIYDQKIRYSSR